MLTQFAHVTHMRFPDLCIPLFALAGFEGQARAPASARAAPRRGEAPCTVPAEVR